MQTEYRNAPSRRMVYDRELDDWVEAGPPKKTKKKKKKTRNRGLIAAFIVIWVIVLLATAAAFIANSELNALKADAETIKTELKNCISNAKAMDQDGVEKSISSIKETNREMIDRLDRPFWKLVSKVPYYGEDIETAKGILKTLGSLTDDVLVPFSDLIQEYPLSSLKVNDSDINVTMVLKYLDFLDSVEPQILSVADELGKADLKVAEIGITEYSDKLKSGLEKLDTLKKYKELLRVFLGNGEDRLYLLMAQNSAETRASGGFPGAMGTITIRDGLLSIGEFDSVYNVLNSANTWESDITDIEVMLYQDMYANWSHDACYNPHFPKVAYITKVAYDLRNEEELDGVVSLTPQIIQKILAVSGASFFLEDGSYLDGENATRTIERQLYLKYMANDESVSEYFYYTDLLFAETASRAMKAMFSNLSAETLLDYVDVIQEGFYDRTVMLWLADEEEETYCYSAGCSGALNFDPDNPIAGVYFSCCDPCKLGMFLEIDTQISDPVTLEDGSSEYWVNVTFNNYINEYAGFDITSEYILGHYGGSIIGYMYFFAPAGGTVSDFETTDWSYVTESEYQDLGVGYVLNEMLYPDQPVTVSYRVTTAPGAAPLQIVTTPTLQDYR